MTALRPVARAAALSLSLALPAFGSSGPTDPREDCAARLDRTLAEMESRPLLKEELATGLMWLRLDARIALEAGDTDLCLSRVRVAEDILGMAPPSN